MKKIIYFILLNTFYSCSNFNSRSISHELKLELNNSMNIGETLIGQKIYLGGLSGLQFLKLNSENEMEFISITDRGPNGYKVSEGRPFLMPNYNPKILFLTTNFKEKKIELKNEIILKAANQKNLTGLPRSRNEENPIDIFGHMISIDLNGVDTESIYRDEDGSFFIGEEYGPNLLHFDSNGKLMKKFSPGEELPKILTERFPNNGFEGIAKFKNKIFGFMQTPFKNESNLSRIVEIDLETNKTSNEYFYPMENEKNRIGDSVALSENEFLVIEQNGLSGNDSKKYIYKITIDKNSTKVSKKLIVDLEKTEFKGLQKVEGLTLIDEKTIALVNDNDFQIDDNTDFKTGITKFNSVKSELLILEMSQKI